MYRAEGIIHAHSYEVDVARMASLDVKGKTGKRKRGEEKMTGVE